MKVGAVMKYNNSFHFAWKAELLNFAFQQLMYT
jgi:hypothetical protein